MVRTLSKFFFFLLTRRPPRYTLFPTRRSSDLFVDIPGFVIGVAGEKAATIRHGARALAAVYQAKAPWCRSEEHTSELQSQSNLVCRLLLEKKKKQTAQCQHKVSGAKDPDYGVF